MRRLAAALALAACAGCLVPQEIEEMEPPREGNSAPRIMLRAPDRFEVITQRACPWVSFALHGIEDFDRADGLEVRWFVDYGLDDTLPELVNEIPASPQMRDGIRPAPVQAFQVQPSNYVHLGRVRIEAIVSDGFDPNPDAEPANRAVLPGKDRDETSWDLIITDDPGCLP